VRLPFGYSSHSIFAEFKQIDYGSGNGECAFRTAPANQNQGSAAPILDLADIAFFA
jgi:hypothetical protein